LTVLKRRATMEEEETKNAWHFDIEGEFEDEFNRQGE
jgi:hypothetical protein